MRKRSKGERTACDVGGLLGLNGTLGLLLFNECEDLDELIIVEENETRSVVPHRDMVFSRGGED